MSRVCYQPDKLTFEHTFSLPTFINMLPGRFHEAFLPFEGTDADV